MQDTNGEKEETSLREPEPVCSCERDLDIPEITESPVPALESATSTNPPTIVMSPALSEVASDSHQDQTSLTSLVQEGDQLTIEDEEDDTVIVKEDSFDDAITGTDSQQSNELEDEKVKTDGGGDLKEEESKEETNVETFKIVTKEETKDLEVCNDENETSDENSGNICREDIQDPFKEAKDEVCNEVKEEVSEDKEKEGDSEKIVDESTVIFPVVNDLANETSESVVESTLSVEIESSDIVVHSDVSKLIEREIVDSDTSEAYLTPTERENDPVEIPQSVSDKLPESVQSQGTLDHSDSGSDKPELPNVNESCSNETNQQSSDIINLSALSEQFDTESKDPSIDHSLSTTVTSQKEVECEAESKSEPEVDDTLTRKESTPLSPISPPITVPGTPQRVVDLQTVKPEPEEEDTLESTESPGNIYLVMNSFF